MSKYNKITFAQCPTDIDSTASMNEVDETFVSHCHTVMFMTLIRSQWNFYFSFFIWFVEQIKVDHSNGLSAHFRNTSKFFLFEYWGMYSTEMYVHRCMGENLPRKWKNYMNLKSMTKTTMTNNKKRNIGIWFSPSTWDTASFKLVQFVSSAHFKLGCVCVHA